MCAEIGGNNAIRLCAVTSFVRRFCGILTDMTASSKERLPLKPAGFFLLVSGWCLVIAAMMMLKQDGARVAFVVAGIVVEAVGLVLVVRAHIAPKPERR